MLLTIMEALETIGAEEAAGLDKDGARVSAVFGLRDLATWLTRRGFAPKVERLKAPDGAIVGWKIGA